MSPVACPTCGHRPGDHRDGGCRNDCGCGLSADGVCEALLDGLHRDLFALTDRQRVAVAQAGRAARDVWGVDRTTGPDWLVFRPQHRRGRGHDVVAVWLDGERMVASHLDVYGNGECTVHDLVLVHGGDECGCDRCAAEAGD